MADLPEQLVVALSADISKLDKQLQKALGNVSDFARKQEGMYKESFSKVERMAAQVDIQNKLSVASAGGDTAAVRSLQEQLELSKQIQRFRGAGMDQAGAEAAARAHLAAVATAQATAAAAQRAAALEQIAIEEKLEVARARGERREVEALEEELALSRAIAKYKSVGFSEAQSKEMAGNQLAALTGARRQGKMGNVGQAVEGTLEHSRLAVLEEGSARLPIFGASLEALGPAGLAAAAGLAATAIAAEQVRKSMEFAEQIEKTAKTLGVSTTQLQAFDDAAIASSIGQDKARESLQSFNEVFGKYSAGLAAGRSAKFLNALGFTPESARQVGDVGDALEKTLVSLAKLQNPQQRASLANQLGLANFLPVIAEGTEGVEKFIAKMREAQTNGSVISPEQIARAAELNDKVEELTHRIGVEFKSAFIDAAPAIENVATFIESCTNKLAQFIATIPDAVAGLRLLKGQGSDAAAGAGSLMGGALGMLPGAGVVGGTASALSAGYGALVRRGKLVHLQDGISDMVAGKKVDFSGVDAMPTPAQGANLAGPPKVKKGPEDKTDDLDSSSKEARDSAAKDLASAQAALAKGFMVHAQFESDAVDADTSKKLDDIAKQELSIRKAKVDAHRVQQQAALDAAKTDINSAAVAKKELISRRATDAQGAFEREVDAQLANAMADNLTSEAAIAATSDQRRRLELAALALRQDTERKAFEAQAKIDMRDKGETQGQVNQARDAMDDRQADARADIIRSTNSPGRTFDRSLNMQKDDLSDQLQTVEVSGVEKLGDALQDVITRTKTVKEAFRDMAMSIVGDLLKIDIQRNIETPLADMLFPPNKGFASVGAISGGSLSSSPSGALDTALTNTGMDPTGNGDPNLVGKGISFMGSLTKMLGIPGFAEGTDDAPGGETLVGERGPELVKLPGGSQVMTNDAVRNLPTAGPGGGGQTINMTHKISIDLTGANGDATIQQIAFQAAAAGSAHAIATGRKDMQRASRSQRQSLIGR